MIVTCPYCFADAELITGEEMYPHREDLHTKSFWICKPCLAWVGCHDGSTKPLGRLANAELRKWKQSAHAKFDPLWKSGIMTRQQSYKVLQNLMNMTPDQAHIGLFDVDQCRQMIEKLTEVQALGMNGLKQMMK